MPVPDPTIYPRPSCLPAWASGVSGFVGATEPIASQKATGWVTGTKPPASYFNWLNGLAYQWLGWLDQAQIKSPAYIVRDDFNGEFPNRSNWYFSGSGMTCIGTVLGESGSAGVLMMFASSGISDNRSSQSVGGGEIPISTGWFRYEARLRAGQSGFANGALKFGCLQGVPDARYAMVQSTGGNWMFIYGTGAVPTSISLGVAPSTGYQTFVIERNQGTLDIGIGASHLQVQMAHSLDKFGPFAQVVASGVSLSMGLDFMSFSAETIRP